MRQKLVWGRTDIKPPQQLDLAIRNADTNSVASFLAENPDWVTVEQLFILACRVPGYEGHGGAIKDGDKCQQHRLEIVRLFLEYGCDVNIRNRRKVTALHMCCRFDLSLVAQFLLQNGADPNAYDVVRETPIYRAVNLGYPACVNILLDSNVQLDFQNRIGQTVLHRAVMRGKRSIVPLLLSAGAPMDLTDHRGFRPIDENLIDMNQNVNVVRSGEIR